MKNKRGRGRPRVAIKKKYRTVAIPEDMWAELFEQAQKYGTSVGRVAWNRIKNGVYDHDEDARDKKEESRLASQNKLEEGEEFYEFE